MPARPPERERLAALMEERRLELGLTWEQVAEAADLKYETLRAARNGNAGIRRLTRRQIARALQWTPDSVDLILSGNDPVALPGLAPSPQSHGPQAPPAPDAGTAAPSSRDTGEIPVITADPGELSPYIDAVWGEIGHAKAAHGPHPAGAQVFPGDVHEARMWDREELSEAERVRLVSFIRMMTARYRRGTNGHGQQAS